MRKPGKQPLILITGSSGVGKSTILKALVKKYPRLTAATSVTTRWPARDEEKFLTDYFFVDDARFDWLLETHQLVENATNYQHRYGTLWAELALISSQDKTPVMHISPSGIEHLSECDYDIHAVFLDFPNAEEQKRRLLAREPHMDHIELDNRLSQAAQERAWALRQASAGQLKIAVNDKLGACVQEVAELLAVAE